MDKQRVEQLLLLCELPYVGEHTLLRLLAIAAEQRKQPEELLHEPESVLRSEFGLAPATVEFLYRHFDEHQRRCEWLARQLTDHGGWVWCFLDPDFPARLAERLTDPAALVFAAGAARLLDRPTCALLQSREPAPYTIAACSSFLATFAAQGFTLVSGAHKTTYRLAATLARSVGSPLVLVLDRGLFHVLGPHLSRDPLTGARWEITPAGQTLVLSAVRLFDHAVARSGRRRDQLIAALADVLLIVHARPGGLIEQLALQALAASRPVVCWNEDNPSLLGAGAACASHTDLGTLASALAHRFQTRSHQHRKPISGGPEANRSSAATPRN